MKHFLKTLNFAYQYKVTTYKMEMEHISHQTTIWVFGYGSLLWKPDFQYTQKETGYIKGFARRFWQGNTTHRGTNENVGRVATLVPRKRKTVWGVAFRLQGRDAIKKALGGLTTREITLGGYSYFSTSFHPRDDPNQPISVLVFIATKDNDMFLGGASTEKMATQIVSARGTAGSNVEYVTRLADYIREHIPEEKDQHLFALDKKIKQLTAATKRRDEIARNLVSLLIDLSILSDDEEKTVK